MKSITKKFVVGIGIALAATTSANAWCDSCYQGCVSRTWDHIGCALSEWLGGDYIHFDPNNNDSKELSKAVSRKVEAIKHNKSSKKIVKKGVQYKQVCSPHKLAVIINSKASAKTVLDKCFKPVKLKKQYLKKAAKVVK